MSLLASARRLSTLRAPPNTSLLTRAATPWKASAAVARRCLSSVPATDEAADDVRHDVRNVAIIAHVDHGTTLVDALLQATESVTSKIGKDDRLMDGNDQEKGAASPSSQRTRPCSTRM